MTLENYFDFLTIYLLFKVSELHRVVFVGTLLKKELPICLKL